MPNAGTLDGLVVIDMATMMAGPHSAMMLADFGATVIKVEPPQGDTSRASPGQIDGVSVYWRVLGRNKYSVRLNLKHPKGRALMLRLVEQADVLVENMRPGKLEALDLAPETLHERNRGLVILRVTGWGQSGPYADRATFGTQAEAMSGFTYLNGQKDGPPTLPPYTIADGSAGYLGAFAIMAALWRRDHDPERRGQVIDLSLFEALFGMFGGAGVASYDRFRMPQERKGSRSMVSAPRNIYRCRDDKWVAISCAAEQIAERLFTAIGRPELYRDPRFSRVEARARNYEELDAIIGGWMGERDAAEVIRLLTNAGATAAPVYSIADIFADEHFKTRDLIIPVDTGDSGPLAMPNVFPKLSETPGEVRWGGRALGADTRYWLGERLGLTEAELKELADEGVI